MKGNSLNVLLPILLTSFALTNCNAPLDNESLQIEIISPKEGATYYAFIPIEIKIADLRTVNRVEVFLDNQLVETFTREPFVSKLDISRFEEKPMNVRVVAHGRGENTAEAQISIHHSHGLRIISPNGGESWREGSTQTIVWEHCGVMADSVGLYYSLDGGSNWTLIAASTLDNDRYTWTVPNISESPTVCRVMVSSIDARHSDTSDLEFIISRWSPVLVGSCKVSGFPIGVFVSEEYTYMTDGYRGLEIIKTTDPTNPKLIATYFTPGDRTWGVFVAGSYAFVADGFLGFHVINVFDPAKPTLVASYDTPGYAYDVLVSEDYAYVADGNAGLLILNVSDPENFALTGTYDTPGSSHSLFKSGSHIHVADGEAGLQIIDVFNPVSPTLTGRYDTPGNAQGVFKSGSYVYVADMEAGLQIINVSNPANPTFAGVYARQGVPHSVFVSGNHAYVADMSMGLQIINVANPASPNLAGSTDGQMFAMEVTVAGDYAYVTEHGGRLMIYDVSGRP